MNRILLDGTSMALRRPSSHDMERSRYVKAAATGKRYLYNIYNTRSQDNYVRSANRHQLNGDMTRNQAVIDKANARKYSRSTYMGVKNAQGGGR